MIIIQNQTVTLHEITENANLDVLQKQIASEMIKSPENAAYHRLDELVFDLRLRGAILEAAEALSKSNARFATFYETSADPKYWNVSGEGGLELRHGRTPAAAVEDIFTNSGAYGFECATAMVIIILRAVLKVIGPEVFNQLYVNLYLWDWEPVDRLPLTLLSRRPFPGDIAYFKNPEVNPKTPWWQGENVIKLIGDRYYGHGIGIGTSKSIIETLNKYRKPDSEVSAYLLETVTEPVYSYFENKALLYNQ